MKKSVLFLINGLGIEKPKSYSIAIDEIMPNLARTKETSYFTTAITSSLEYRSAYQRFFLGDTYKMEIDYIKNNIINDNIVNNPTYQKLAQEVAKTDKKLHIFLEPTNDKVVEEVNHLLSTLTIDKNKKIYLHLLLSQLTTNEYDKLITIINFIKFHISQNVTVGFVMGKESLAEEITKEQLDYTKKLLFYCSAERWTETEKKLQSLKESNIRPCNVEGFCTTNECFITNGDAILFFNTKRDNYDNILKSIYENAPQAFKDEVSLSIFSLVKLYSKYNIEAFIENITYSNSLASILQKYNKKALIITDSQNMNLVNFYANGLNSINNPYISFAPKDENLYNKDYIDRLINNTPYDLFIFDYHMDASSTVNNLKEKLTNVDIIIGHLADACVNKNSLFITSLYGLKKELPLADYNTEMVTIDYEMQIPIFFFDYSYLKSKYKLYPGETNDILSSALRCIIDDPELYTLVRSKSLINGFLGK